MNILFFMTSQLEMNHRLLKERFMSENEIVTHFEVDFGNEPEPIRFIDENGNETVRYVQKRITIGNETVLEFADENENELRKLMIGNENENQFQNENGNGNGFENENEKPLQLESKKGKWIRKLRELIYNDILE